MLENGALRKKTWTAEVESGGGTSSNNIRVKKSRIGWAGHVARMGEMRNAYKILVGKTEETIWKTYAWVGR
jgi:hypothetical protein